MELPFLPPRPECTSPRLTNSHADSEVRQYRGKNTGTVFIIVTEMFLTPLIA